MTTRVARGIDDSAETAQDADGLIHRLQYRRVGFAVVEVAQEADAFTSDIAIEAGSEVRDRHIGGGGVKRIVAGERVHHDCAVAYVPSYRPAGVKRVRKRRDTTARDAAVGRL